MGKIAAAIAYVLALCAPSLAFAQTPETPQPIHANKIILIGDSTMQVMSGWGGMFCAHHVMSMVACVDLGRGGRSTLSYRAEGSWDVALSEMSTRGFEHVYVLIQFGHNDQPGKPGRSTDLATEFPANLARYVREARANGAVPIMVTPLTRRQFVNGQLQNDLAPWADAVRRVAMEMHTPLLDLNADSAAAVQALGPAMSAHFAETVPPADVATAFFTGTTIAAIGAAPPPSPTPQPASPPDTVAEPRPAFDYTHLGDAGAEFFASMVARELIVAVPELRHSLAP